MKVNDCMCKEVICVHPETTVGECAQLMKDHHVGCIPVCDTQNTLVGLVTDRDIILRSVACSKEVHTTPVSDIMTCNVCCCPPDTNIQDAEHLMQTNKIRRLPVVENNKVIGILTLGDLASNTKVDNTQVSSTLEDICKDKKQNAE